MSYESHLRNAEMGVAYKEITAKMGPSPQLIAFVNYDKALDENCGLESMDVMSQHETILAEIEAFDDTSFDAEMSSDEFADMDGVELFQLSGEIDQLEKDNKEFIETNRTKIDQLKKLAARADDSDDSDEVKVGKIIRRTAGSIDLILRDLENSPPRARAALKNVAKHLKD